MFMEYNMLLNFFGMVLRLSFFLILVVLIYGLWLKVFNVLIMLVGLFFRMFVVLDFLLLKSFSMVGLSLFFICIFNMVMVRLCWGLWDFWILVLVILLLIGNRFVWWIVYIGLVIMLLVGCWVWCFFFWLMFILVMVMIMRWGVLFNICCFLFCW